MYINAQVSGVQNSLRMSKSRIHRIDETNVRSASEATDGEFSLRSP